MKLVLDWLIMALAWGSPWLIVLALWLIMGCASPPSPVAELCLEDECILVPSEHAEFVMDWCEFRLPEDEARELDLWSKRNIAR